MNRFLKAVFQLFDSNRAVFVIVGLGLVLRVFVLIVLSDYPLRSDALAYHRMTIRLLEGEHFAPFRPPGVPCYLSLTYCLLGSEEWVGRAAMIVFFVVLSGFLYLLGTEVSNRKTANLCLLVFSMWPTHLHLSVEPLTQLPTAACLTAIAYLTIRVCKHPTWRAAVPLGLLLGGIALLRPSTLLLAVCVPAYVLKRTKSAPIALTPLVLSFAIVSIWLFKANRMTDRFVMINYANSQNLFYGNNIYTPLYKTWWFGSHARGEVDVPTEFSNMFESIQANPHHVRDRLYWRYSLEHIVSRPDLFLLRTVNRIRAYFAFDTYTGSYFLKQYRMNKWLSLMVMGADAVFYCSLMAAVVFYIFSFRSRNSEPEHVMIIVGTAILYALPYWVSFSHPTYHFPVVPPLGILGATAVTNLVAGPKTGRPGMSRFSPGRKLGLVLALVVLLYIQIEWVAVMRTAV